MSDRAFQADFGAPIFAKSDRQNEFESLICAKSARFLNAHFREVGSGNRVDFWNADFGEIEISNQAVL